MTCPFKKCPHYEDLKKRENDFSKCPYLKEEIKNCPYLKDKLNLN